MELFFHTVESERDINRLVNFISARDLNYPGYQDWVERAREELRAGYKRAIVAEHERRIAGDIIFQPHKQTPYLIEMKNLRVAAGWRGRHFAAAMERQIEPEFGAGFYGITADARESQRDVIAMLMHIGYFAARKVCLYDEEPDIVLCRLFGNQPRDFALTI